MGSGAKCSSCGHRLDHDHVGPCPECGHASRTYNKALTATVLATGSLSWKKTHEYYKKRPLLCVFQLCITLGSPCLGLVLRGWLGLLAGLALGVISLLLGLRAVTRVRETTGSPRQPV